jgi:hypothetical protein
LRGVRREELTEGFGGGDGAVVFDMNIEVESGVCASGNDTGIVESPLRFCSFIAAAAAATLPSTDEDSGGGTLLLS